MKIIAFNAENDLEKPPDRGYVHGLENSFPGTIVSIRLNLDEAYLAKIAGEEGRTDVQSS